MDLHSKTSKTLLGRLRNPNDQAAWTQFHERYAPVVLLWCRDARASQLDVFQEVMKKFFQMITQGRFQYDPSKTLRGFLRVMAKTAVADAITDLKKRKVIQGEQADALLATAQAPGSLYEEFEKLHNLEVYRHACPRVRQRLRANGSLKTWKAYRYTSPLRLGGKEMSNGEAAARLKTTANNVAAARKNVKNMFKEEVRAILKDELSEGNP